MRAEEVRKMIKHEMVFHELGVGAEREVNRLTGDMKIVEQKLDAIADYLGLDFFSKPEIQVRKKDFDKEAEK